jgi:trans-2,3-dihydro-3-hydroxyanthranilate isomerase
MGGPSGLPLTWLDVFTATPLAGNQLAVVGDADVLDDATMLAFARETGLSETTFVQSAGAAGADYRNRIMWPGGELPFAGHPSLGTAVAVALARGDRAARYVQETPAGLQPVEVQLDGRAARAAMLQEPAVFGAAPDPGAVFAALGLEAADADRELLPQVVSTGVAHLMACTRDAAVLARAAPSADALRAVLRAAGAHVAYLAWWDRAAGTAATRGYWLAPAGLAEDAATGSAAGPLMALLHERAGARRLTVRQGVEMGRPSLLECAIEDDRVRVAGDVVVVAQGRVFL